MVNFAGVIEIVSDHNSDDPARRQLVAPVGKTLAVELGIIGEIANRIQPAVMAIRQPHY